MQQPQWNGELLQSGVALLASVPHPTRDRLWAACQSESVGCGGGGTPPLTATQRVQMVKQARAGLAPVAWSILALQQLLCCRFKMLACSGQHALAVPLTDSSVAPRIFVPLCVHYGCSLAPRVAPQLFCVMKMRDTHDWTYYADGAPPALREKLDVADANFEWKTRLVGGLQPPGIPEKQVDWNSVAGV